MGAANSLNHQCMSSSTYVASDRRSWNSVSKFLGESEISVHYKKKKASKFATIRKKLTRICRNVRSHCYGKFMRELMSQWTIHEIQSLVNEYEFLAALKELTILAEGARPTANSLRDDLALVFDHSICTDIFLMYRGAVIPAHRAILSMRCLYFRDLFQCYPYHGAKVPVKVRTIGVDVATFTALIRYLYTDELHVGQSRNAASAINDSSSGHISKVLKKLIDEFGMPNPLENDIRFLFELGSYSDAVLAFTTDKNDLSARQDPAVNTSTSQSPLPPSSHECHELHCHKVILAARSQFFRSFLQRRETELHSGCSQTSLDKSSPCRILLDETVIPKRYARVLLQVLYTDIVDLSSVIRPNPCIYNSLTEVQAIVAGRGNVTHIDEAMDIYYIGLFLDLPILSQGCEDIIAEGISNDNLISVLDWGREAHGSRWVYRQALHYLREEFLQISHSNLLCDLDKHYIISAVKSNFLQAPEEDVLAAVLKWGECYLMKRMEEREPNLLSHTAHSVAKKGIKKRDLNDTELREILSDLLPYVCINHVIPQNSELLTSMVRRKLVSQLPPYMLGDDQTSCTKFSWINHLSYSGYTRPRYFLPFYEEAKVILDERKSQQTDYEDRTSQLSAKGSRMMRMSSVPDTLYMINDQTYQTQSPSFPTLSCTLSTVDIIAGSVPVPDEVTLRAMIKREHLLRQTPLTRFAFSLRRSLDHRAVMKQIHLRVVREFGFPDTTVEVLQRKRQFLSSDDDEDYFEERHFIPIRPSPDSCHLPKSVSVSPLQSLFTNSADRHRLICETVPDVAMPSNTDYHPSGQLPSLLDCGLDLGD